MAESYTTVATGYLTARALRVTEQAQAKSLKHDKIGWHGWKEADTAAKAAEVAADVLADKYIAENP
jgi:hypothetical protein